MPFALGAAMPYGPAVHQSRFTTSTWSCRKATSRQRWIHSPPPAFRSSVHQRIGCSRHTWTMIWWTCCTAWPGVPVERGLIDTATEREILGVRIPVLPPTPIMIAKLLSLSEHYANFASLLPPVRAVREQLDWPAIASAVEGHPFAEAFLVLVERLPEISDTGVSDSDRPACRRKPTSLTAVLKIARGHVDAMIAHARADHPDEACGVIIGAAGSDQPTRLVQMINADRSPTFFRFDPGEQFRLYQEMDRNDEEIVVVYHSHTATEAYPLRTDISLAAEPRAHMCWCPAESGNAKTDRSSFAHTGYWTGL